MDFIQYSVQTNDHSFAILFRIFGQTDFNI